MGLFDDIPQASTSKVKELDLFADLPSSTIRQESDSVPTKQSIAKRIYEKLSIPEKLSREGLKMLTERLTPSMEEIESGQMEGSPIKIASRPLGEALTETAPSFV